MVDISQDIRSMIAQIRDINSGGADIQKSARRTRKSRMQKYEDVYQEIDDMTFGLQAPGPVDIDSEGWVYYNKEDVRFADEWVYEEWECKNDGDRIAFKLKTYIPMTVDLKLLV